MRSNGTVGYVGKDIAYHLWKFGLLGTDFGYRKFYQLSQRARVLDLGDPKHGEPEHPHFGGVAEIYNVIDARQSDPQDDGDRSAARAWATTNRPTTTPTSPTRWWRSRRAARWNWATTCQRRGPAEGLHRGLAAARDSA